MTKIMSRLEEHANAAFRRILALSIKSAEQVKNKRQSSLLSQICSKLLYQVFEHLKPKKKRANTYPPKQPPSS